MKRWTSTRVAEAVGVAFPGTGVFSGIATDTRRMARGALFVALVGQRFDGHAFLGAARDAGAAGAVVRRGTPPVDGLLLFEVDDTLAALGALGRARRRDLAGPVVAVTGSNGKTATRALIAAALATRWRVHATPGNLNNLVGVPLTILDAPDVVDALVVECGASELGEIGRLRGIVEPTIGVVTNAVKAHLAGFRDLEGVLREKTSLLTGVPVAVVGTTPPELATAARREAQKVMVAGLADHADLRPDRWRLDDKGRAEVTFRGHTLRLTLVGRHQADNAMLALAVAAELELDLRSVSAALADVTLPHGRCEIIRSRDLLIVHDAYNANPASLLAALETAQALQGKRPLVVLVGSMLELGGESRRLHREMADAIVAADPALVGAVGEFVAAFQPHAKRLGSRLVTAADADALGRAVAERLGGDELVLLKASRGVALEQALRHVVPGWEDACSTTS